MSLPSPAPIYYSKRARQYLLDLWNRREFAWFLALGNLKARNASTALGLFWWVLNPLLLTAVYFLVFVVLIDSARDIAYLMSGMFVFHFTGKALTGGASAVLNNSKLIINQRFPRLILPISQLIEASIGFLVSLVVFYVVLFLATGILPGPQAALLLFVFPLHAGFNLGVAALSARLAIPFRDIQNITPYLSRLWFYLSPVLWTPALLSDRAPGWAVGVAEANPMYAIISVYRGALISEPFETAQLLQVAVWCLVVGIVGVSLFVKFESRIARYL